MTTYYKLKVHILNSSITICVRNDLISYAKLKTPYSIYTEEYVQRHKETRSRIP